MRQERWETLVREGLGLQAGAGKYLGRHLIWKTPLKEPFLSQWGTALAFEDVDPFIRNPTAGVSSLSRLLWSTIPGNVFSRFTPSSKADLMSWRRPDDREALYICSGSREKAEAE